MLGKTIRSLAALTVLTTATAAFMPQAAHAAAFTAGNLVVYRVGDGSATLGSPATATFLDEYSPTGTLVQSIPLPTAVSGTNFQCTNSGTATTEGLITASADGAYLVGGCYAAATGTASITTATPATVPRVIFRADSSGVIDTTTALTDTVSGGNPRATASTNGTDLWATSSSGGVRYVALGATSSTQLNSATTNLRGVSVYGGQLYISSGAGTIRLATVGTGAPKTTGQTLTQLPGIPTGTITNNAFVLLDLSATVAGVDTAYVADESAGIVKYSFDGTTWTAKGTVGVAGDTYRGITASVSGGNVTLYAIRKSNELVKLTDNTGSTGTLAGTPTSLATTGTVNKAFRSVAFAPVSLTPPPTPTLSVAAPATITEGNTGTSTATFTVSLDNPALAGGVTFKIDTVDGTASAGSDYVAIVGGNGSIAPGQTSTTFNVTINGDTVYEGNETFSVNLSNITNATNTVASVVATITEDDQQPTITVGDASVVEGNSGSTVMSFPVTLSNASTQDVSFTAQTQNGSAMAGSDYDTLTTTVTISAGMTSGTIFVGIHGDTTQETDETFTLQLSAPVNGSLGNNSATGTILNDDNVTPTFSINSVTHAEGNSGTTSFVFTVSSNVNAPTGGYTLNVDTADGTATVADNDYTAVHTTVTIPAGQTSAPVTVLVNGDTNFEADETFSVTLSNQPAGANLGNATGTGTITNDDTAPTLSVANVSVNEGNSGTTNATFTVSLTNPASSNVTFTINTADGTATAGSDYVAIVNGTGTITAGSTSTTVAVTINGDTAIEPNETFTLNLSAITNTANATASATGTILNDDITTIMQIQGHGTASLLNGQTVTTGGVVTAKKSNGFFMQDPDGDSDLTTSDAIFVFTGSAPTVSVNDAVTVTGKVQEFSGSTELSGTLTVTVNAHPSTKLPAAFVLDAHAPTNDPTTGICVGGNSTISNPPAATDGYQASNFACLDGMLITINDATVSGATFGSAASDGVHVGLVTGTYITVTGTPRPFHGPGAMWPGIAGNPLIPVWNGEPEVFELYYPGLAYPGLTYNAGARIAVTGVIQGFTATGAASPIYEMYPYLISSVAAAPDYPQAVAASAEGTLTIGSQNMLHFFNSTADGADTSGFTDNCAGTGSSDTCPTRHEYNERLAKWTRQICDTLKAPVVMDIEEIENIAVARDLANGILHGVNDDTTTPTTPLSSGCGVTYQPYLIPGNDVSGINIGILVRDDVQVSSVTQMYKDTQTANCSGAAPCLLNDRPPVLMRASWNGYAFALLAIYDRSLSGITTTDPAKLYVGAKRAEQAAQIAQIAQAFQSGATLAGIGNAQQNALGTVTNGPFDIVGDVNVPLIIAGDFNAYEFSDGIADVTGMITGRAVQAQNFFWYNGNQYDPTPAYVAPSPLLVDSGIKAAPGERYSFNFSGLAQEIDHIVLSQRAWKDFVSIANAHGNSDVSEADPVILDPSTAARSGDHDGQVVTIAIDRIFADGLDPQP